MMKTVTANQALVAAALALIGQGAMSDETRVKRNETDVVRVTVPRQQTKIEVPVIATDAQETIEALKRQLEQDLERDLAEIGESPVELAIAEVPTRG